VRADAHRQALSNKASAVLCFANDDFPCGRTGESAKGNPLVRSAVDGPLLQLESNALLFYLVSLDLGEWTKYSLALSKMFYFFEVDLDQSDSPLFLHER
jgi:hypothetical protein